MLTGTDHGRYWIRDVVKLSVTKLTNDDRAYGFKRAVDGGHYERVNCQSLEEVLRPWLTFLFSAGEEISHTQAERLKGKMACLSSLVGAVIPLYKSENTRGKCGKGHATKEDIPESSVSQQLQYLWHIL